MIAKFLDDNKHKTSLKKWICTVSNFIDLIQYPPICQILAEFSKVESEKDWIYWKFRKKKQNFYAVFTYVIHKVGAWN